MRHTRRWGATLVGAFLLAGGLARPAAAQVSFLGPGAFLPSAPAITFSEYASGTVNPHYDFNAVPGLGNVSVDFGGAFMGQSTVDLYGNGSVISLSGSPTGPLALDPTSPQTFITGDAAQPHTPVLSGTPTYNGPISILFGTPVAAVGLNGGYFNAVHSTFIQAFDALGNSLGSVTNSQEGIEFFGVVTNNGANQIKGISFYITDQEPAGFTVDDVTFGAARDLTPGTVTPEPATVVFMATGLILLGLLMAFRRRREGEGGVMFA